MADKGAASTTASPATKQARPKMPQKQPAKGWGKLILEIFLMMLWVAVAVIASQLVVGYIMIWTLGEDTFVEPVWTTVYTAISYVLAVGLVFLVSRKKVGRRQLGLRGWPTWTDIGLAVVGFLAQLILAAALTALFMIFPWFQEIADQSQDVGFSVLNSGLDRVVAFIALVVIAPIAEEIIFRGWLYGIMRRKLSEKVSNVAGMVISILLVSLLFGLVHMQWNVGVNVFATSVVLCGLREVTGTIYAGILVHMLKNGVAFYLLYVAGV